MTTGNTTYDLFVSYSEDNREWVEGYLLPNLNLPKGKIVTHTDFSLGALWISEFENAIKNSRYTLLILTPAYLSEKLSIFSEQLASYASVVGTNRLIPLFLEECLLPLHLDFRVRINCTKQTEWKLAVDRLRNLLEQPEISFERIACPYPGMSPFSEANSSNFFGRDREVLALLNELRLNSFQTIIGPSGSGKSSLVFAGLVPALRNSTLYGDGEWLVRSIRPGENPLGSLFDVLNIREPADLPNAVVQLLAANHAKRLLIIVDQFEELFTLTRTSFDDFQEAILALPKMSDCFLILTVRADFYPDLMATRLWPEIQKHRLEVLPLDDNGLREAIVKPAANVGVFIEAALVQRLLMDAAGEPGVLPFVQETLVLLWERLEQRFLPLAAYELLASSADSVGSTGLQAAMARRADAAIARLIPEQEAIARRIFLRLVQFGEGRADTRRQQSVSELHSHLDTPSEFDYTIRHLIDSRLLTSSSEDVGADRQIDIAHEALIEGWGTLRVWLSERRDAENTRRRLQEKAGDWIGLGAREGGLLDEIELLEAERWLNSPDAQVLGYSHNLLALIDCSRQKQEQVRHEKEEQYQREIRLQKHAAQRLRYLVVGLGLFLIIAIALTLFAFNQQQEAEEQSHGRATQQALAESKEQEAVDSAATSIANASTATVAQGQAIIEADQRATQQIRAEHAEATAIVDRDHAISSRLAAQVINLSKPGNDISVPLLLGLEALNIDESNPEVRASVMKALETLPELDTILWQESGVISTAISPDGSYIVSGGYHGDINVWDMSTKHLLHRLLMGNDIGVDRLEFSDDGSRLMAVSRGSLVVIWDTSRWEPVGPLFTEHNGNIATMSHDGKYIASADNYITQLWVIGGEYHGYQTNHGIQLWDTATGNPVGGPMLGHTNLILDITFSPDNQVLASASYDGTVRLWDVETGDIIGRPLESMARVTAVAFSGDGNILMSGGCGAIHESGDCIKSELSFWDVKRQEKLRENIITLETTSEAGREHFGPWRMRVSQNNNLLAVANTNFSTSSVQIWDLDSFELAEELPGVGSQFIEDLDFGPNDNTLVSTNSYGTVFVWVLGRQSRLQRIPENEGFFAHRLTYSPKGDILAATAHPSLGPIVKLWDTATGESVGEIETYHHSVGSIAFSSNGQILATGGDIVDATVILWDFETRAAITKPLAGHGGAVWALDFNEADTLLASASMDNSVRIWSVPDGKLVDILEHNESVIDVKFLPDAETILTRTGSAVIFWDLSSGQPTGKIIPVTTSNYYQNIEVSPDDNTLAVVSGDSALIWDIQRGTIVGELPVYGLEDLQNGIENDEIPIYGWGILTVAFNPDGSLLAICDGSGKIKIWSTKSQSYIVELPGFWHDIEYSPTGTSLAAVSVEGTLAIWDTDIEVWHDQACRLAQRNLTEDEWAQYLGNRPYNKICSEVVQITPTPLAVAVASEVEASDTETKELNAGVWIDATLENESMWTFEAMAGQTVVISIWSDEFDARVGLRGPDNNLISENDTYRNLSPNPQIGPTELASNGTYTVVVSSQSSGGAYRLHLIVSTPREIAIGDTVISGINNTNGHIWKFSAEAGQVITVAINAPEDTLTVALYDWNGQYLVTGGLVNTTGSDVPIKDFSIPSSGIYQILITAENTEYALSLLDASMVEAIAQKIDKSVSIDERGLTLLRGDVTLCHKGYRPLFAGLVWGIAWLQNDTEQEINSGMEVKIMESGNWETAEHYTAMPGGVDFVILPASAVDGIAGTIDWTKWGEDFVPLLRTNISSKLEAVQIPGNISLSLYRHFSNIGIEPYLHHTISVSVANRGESSLDIASGIVAFAVYNTNHELIDMGVLPIDSLTLPNGQDILLDIQSLSGSGSCVQAYDPAGHEIWVGLTARDNNGNVLNAFEQFPAGSIPFEKKEF